jgi:hypothetical protein
MAAGDLSPLTTQRRRRAVHFVRGAGVAAAIDIVVMLAVFGGGDLGARPRLDAIRCQRSVVDAHHGAQSAAADNPDGRMVSDVLDVGAV